MLAFGVVLVGTAFQADPPAEPVMLPVLLRLAQAPAGEIARQEALLEQARGAALAEGRDWRLEAGSEIRLASADSDLQRWCRQRAGLLAPKAGGAKLGPATLAALYGDLQQARGEQAAAADLAERAAAIAARAAKHGRPWEQRHAEAEKLARQRAFAKAEGRANTAAAVLARAAGLDPAVPLAPQEPLDLAFASTPAVVARCAAAQTRLAHAGRAVELCLGTWSAEPGKETPATPAEAAALTRTLDEAYAEFFDALHESRRQAALAPPEPPAAPNAVLIPPAALKPALASAPPLALPPKPAAPPKPLPAPALSQWSVALPEPASVPNASKALPARLDESGWTPVK